MTETQKLRNMMFDEIERLKRGTADVSESLTVVKLANSIISTYNTELKAIETMIEVQDRGAIVPSITLLEDIKDV